MGYKTKEIVVNKQAVINVTLEADQQQLDEVVVVGYGTQKKVNLTGSIAAVGQEELKDRINTDVLKAIQGTVPGVTIISRPGSDAAINFRGRGNLGSSTPLYVIDGAIADAEFFPVWIRQLLKVFLFERCRFFRHLRFACCLWSCIGKNQRRQERRNENNLQRVYGF